MGSSTDTLSTARPTPPDDSSRPITGIRLYLQPEDEALVIGLCNVGERLAQTNPTKAEGLQREVLRVIRERIQLECL